MAQDYDVVLKLLFRSKSSQAVQEIAGGAVKRWLDKELPAIRNTRADLIAETIGGEIVHLEIHERESETVRASGGGLLRRNLSGLEQASSAGAGLPWWIRSFVTSADPPRRSRSRE